LFMKQFTRPKNRSECINGPRPCPWVGCRYHLLFDWKYIARDIEQMTDEEVVELMWQMPETCALDVIEDYEPMTLQEIADLFGGMSRERVRQFTVRGKKLWLINALMTSSATCEYYVESTSLQSAS